MDESPMKRARVNTSFSSSVSPEICLRANKALDDDIIDLEFNSCCELEKKNLIPAQCFSVNEQAEVVNLDSSFESVCDQEESCYPVLDVSAATISVEAVRDVQEAQRCLATLSMLAKPFWSPKIGFSWNIALNNTGATDILSLILNNLGIAGLMNAFLVCKHWMYLISNCGPLHFKLSVSLNFMGLYRVERSLSSNSSLVGSLKYQNTAPFCNHRSILVDWLVDVQMEYNLSIDTFHTSVLLIDRCLSLDDNCPSNKLQLLGITCLFIASKFCEIVHPLLQDMVWVCDNTYSREEHVEMEMQVMSILNFQVYIVTPGSYVSALKDSLGEDSKVEQLANYLVDISLVNGWSIGKASAMIAAVSFCLALHTLNRPLHLELIAQLCRTSTYGIRENLCKLQKIHIDDFHACEKLGATISGDALSQPIRAVHDRYVTDKCLGVARIPPRRELIVNYDAATCDAVRLRCWWCGSSTCAQNIISRRCDFQVIVHGDSRAWVGESSRLESHQDFCKDRLPTPG